MKILQLVVPLLAASCVSSSIQSDLQKVTELSRAAMLAPVAGPVEPLTTQEVKNYLSKRLDVEAAVRLALLNNRELRAQLRDVGIERGQLMQAGAVANPLLEVEILPERNSALELRVEYDVTSLVLAPIRANAASFDLEAARYRAAGAVVQTGYDVRVAFYALQASETRLAIARTTLKAASAARDAAEALFRSGNTRELDFSIRTTAFERAKIAVAQLELEQLDNREKMQRLMGLYGEETKWELAGPLPSPPPLLETDEGIETRAVDASLDLRETRSRLEALARKAGYSKWRGWLPEIAVDVHGLHGNPETGQSGEWRFGGGISVGVPSFDQQRGATTSLEAQRDALVERYYGLAIAVRSEVREARNRLRSAHLRAKQYHDVIVPSQTKVVEQTLLQYNAMQLGVFHLLQARREQLDIDFAYVETLREFWTAQAGLQALLSGRRAGGPTAAAAMQQVSMPAGAGH